MNECPKSLHRNFDIESAYEIVDSPMNIASSQPSNCFPSAGHFCPPLCDSASFVRPLYRQSPLPFSRFLNPSIAHPLGILRLTVPPMPGLARFLHSALQLFYFVILLSLTLYWVRYLFPISRTITNHFRYLFTIRKFYYCVLRAYQLTSILLYSPS